MDNVRCTGNERTLAECPFNGWNVHSIVCRGEDPSGHWADHPRPEGELIPVKGEDEDGLDPTRASLSGVGISEFA